MPCYSFGSDKQIRIFIFFLIAIYLPLSIIGGFRNFSSVPLFDIWNGYVNFLERLQNSSYEIWWEQYNEHRLVFSRLLFWVDFNIFNGSLIFLIFCNYTLATLIFYLLWNISQRCLHLTKNDHLFYITLFYLIIFAFSWIQKENFLFAFQNQFFAAHFFPLLAFYLLYLSVINEKHSACWFSLALFAGIISVGTMANGILTLPFMVILSALFKIKPYRIFIIILTTALMIYLYFLDYHATAGHGSILQELKTQPLQFTQYVLAYLGQPFYRAMSEDILLAQLAGLFFIVSTLFFTYVSFHCIKKHSLQIVLLCFIAYICAEAVATAGGRLMFGIEQAFSSRYSTPALMGWSCLSILYFSFFKEKQLLLGKKAYFLLLVPLLLFPYQFRTLHSYDYNFKLMVAALALELNIKDTQYIEYIFPSSEEIGKFSQKIKNNDEMIFGHVQIKNAAELLGTPYHINLPKTCIGKIENTTVLNDDPAFVRLSGWFYNPASQSYPDKILIIMQGKIVGYVITGNKHTKPKPDLPRNARYSGFTGYMFAKYVDKNIQLIDPDSGCVLNN